MHLKMADDAIWRRCVVLSTQALLYSVGLGAGAIPTAAAVNWVLKDGLGQLGGVVRTL